MKKKKVARSRAAKKVRSRRAKPARAASKTSVSFTLDPRRDGLEPLLGAAYLMTDRAYARLDGDAKKSLRVTLTPKGDRGAKSLAALEADFRAELESQRLRWAVARANRPVREYVAENALTLAEEFEKRSAAAPAPAGDQLTDAQRAEIARLIAEVEGEIKEMNAKPKADGRAETALSWEAAQEQGGQGAPSA
jgi:His-Xaa-Ser system protein HxsD